MGKILNQIISNYIFLGAAEFFNRSLILLSLQNPKNKTGEIAKIAKDKHGMKIEKIPQDFKKTINS